MQGAERCAGCVRTPSMVQTPSDNPTLPHPTRTALSVPPHNNRLVTFPGTHNSNALKTNFANLAESQKLTFREQLQVNECVGRCRCCCTKQLVVGHVIVTFHWAGS